MVTNRLLYMCGLLFILFSRTFGDVAVQNVHIALSGVKGGMFVSWLTKDNAKSIVKYGPTSGSYNYQASGSSDTYEKSAGYNHNVELKGLEPGTRYYYICGDGSTMSSEFSFKTEPTKFEPFTIGIWGDMGVDNSENTIARIKEKTKTNDFDFIWHLGDLSYANDHVFYEDVWNEWFTEMEPIMANVPYMTSVGNHEWGCREIEISCYEITKNFTTYKKKFHMPKNSMGETQNMFYSYDYGNVHVISISTETGFPGAPEGNDNNWQLLWLENDLKKVNQNRKKTPWVFVGGHRPIYSAGIGHHDGNVPTGADYQLQQAIEKLLHDYKVDVLWSGHVHLYERQYPAYQNKRVSDNYKNLNATVNIISGGAGNIEGLTYLEGSPIWHAFGNDKDFGYGVLKVWNDTDIEWNYYNSANNQLIDSIWMSK